VPLQGGPARTDDVPSEEEYTTWLEWLITSPSDAESPKHYIERVQEEYGAKSNVCGRIWGKGYVAYRCRTCGMSPCSAICHECFEKGPHRDHNFLMYRSVAGGCCDCGDPGKARYFTSRVSFFYSAS
jgi:E3 ubiquitin-protein ligase UBR3